MADSRQERPPRPPEHVPGFVTVWHAQDEGPPQDAVCPTCEIVIGSVGERGKTELLCRKCQTMFRVEGRPGGTPNMTAAGRRTLVGEGDGRLGDALRGKRPAAWHYGTGDYVFQVILIILLFAAILLSMNQ